MKKTLSKVKSKRIFMDYASITPTDARVEKRVLEVGKKYWANPSSLHTEGEKAKEILENTRKEIAKILHTKSGEVYFTSGGTESANIAINGVVIKARENGIKNPHIITSSVEHPAVLECVKTLSKYGVEVSYVSPDKDGIIKPESIAREIKENTVLVCLMHANNEIGVIQKVRKASTLIKEYKQMVGQAHQRENPSGFARGKSNYPYLLVDACQSFLYENVSIDRLGADILFIDGIKIYGPRGVGALAIKSGVEIASFIKGGGQEHGLRSGTENVPAVAGLLEAMQLAVKMREKESNRLTKIRDYAIDKILKEIPGSILNGSKSERLPNNVNICFQIKKSEEDSEFLVIKLDTLGIAVSSASACNNLKAESSSYVVESLGPSTSSGQVRDCGASSIRFSFGRETKKSDIDTLVSTLKKVLK